MTLQNGLISDREAYLWTDTALWNAETGEMIGHTSKAFMGTMWPWAAVLSGTFDATDLHRVQRSIAEACPLCPASLIAACQAALRAERRADRVARILLAYVHSDSEPGIGPRLFLIASDAMPFAKPFEAYELGEYMSSGSDAEFARDFADQATTPERMREFIGKQVEHPAETTLGWRGASFLGGNIIELKVSASGVENRVLGAIPERTSA